MAGLAGTICPFSLTRSRMAPHALYSDGRKRGLSCSPSFPRKAMPSKFSSFTSLRVNRHSARSGLLSSTSASHPCGGIRKSFPLWTTLHRVVLVLVRNHQPVLPVQCHCPCDFEGAHILWASFLCLAWGLYHIPQQLQSLRVLTEPQHELLREGLSFSLKGPSGSSAIKLTCAT